MAAEEKPELPGLKEEDKNEYNNRVVRSIVGVEQVNCLDEERNVAEKQSEIERLNAEVQSKRKHIETVEEKLRQADIEEQYKRERIEALEEGLRRADVNDQSKRERIETLQERLRRADVHEQSKRERIETLEASTRLSRRQNAELKISSRNKTWLIYVLLVCPVLLGYLGYTYYMEPPVPPPVQIAQVQHATVPANIAQFVVLNNENFLWRIDTLNYWHFTKLSAFVRPVNLTTINITFAVNIKSDVNAFKASIIMQLLDPTATKDHHVSRLDVLFTAAGEKDWYITDSTKVIDLVGSDRKFYVESENGFRLRIVNVEVGLNDVLPIPFSMCHFHHYKKNNHLLWDTFPFYVKGYKFMIYVYANGKGTSKGKALTMELYRMRGERDEMLPGTIGAFQSIVIQLLKDGGGYAIKEFEIAGDAAQRVQKGVKVHFSTESQIPSGWHQICV